jgi:PAS domain S-box-containing protein
MAVLLGGISAFISLDFPKRAERRILRAVASEARDISRIAAFSVAPALFFGDAQSGLETLRGVEETPEVVYVVVTDARGKPFASLHAEAARKARFDAAGTEGAVTPDEAVYRVSSPVSYGGRTIGRLHAGLSLAPVRADIQKMRSTIAAGSALIFLLGLAAAIGIGTVVTRPLAQMVETSREIAHGQWHLRAPIASRDEAGQLAVSFNQMLDAFDVARRDLEELNRNLEGRVAERTHELETENQERRRGEQALGRANERFALAAAAVNGAIYDWDMLADQVLWTEGLTRVFGYSLEEVPETVEWWSARIHAEDRPHVEEELRHATGQARDFFGEYRFRGKDDGYFHVLDRGRILRDEAGRPVRMVGIIENVTEIKRLQEEFRQSQKMEAVGRLAGGVAHDFNNLLTTILGYSHLMLGHLGEDAPERLEMEEIRKAGERAAALTQQLLAFSRKQVIEPRVLDVNAVVANMEKMLRRLIGEDIALETHLDSSAARIRADKSQLEQVILNVAVNSRDAMPRGGRFTIRTSPATLDEPFVRQHLGARAGRYTAIVLSDTGSGMDAATLSRIFEPFFTTKETGRGTGLGMATVYGIVKQSEGYVWVDSKPGAGTRVWIYLPEAQETAADISEDAVTLPLPRGSEIVLLVEDEEAVRSLVRGLLRSHGYVVLEASDAGEALRISNDFDGPIHLLLTDVVMPEVSGRELADRLHETRQETRLLYMSGYTEDTIVQHGVLTSGVSFLHKPFTPEQLLRKVRETLDRPGLRAVS